MHLSWAEDLHKAERFTGPGWRLGAEANRGAGFQKAKKKGRSEWMGWKSALGYDSFTTQIRKQDAKVETNQRGENAPYRTSIWLLYEIHLLLKVETITSTTKNDGQLRGNLDLGRAFWTVFTNDYSLVIFPKTPKFAPPINIWRHIKEHSQKPHIPLFPWPINIWRDVKSTLRRRKSTWLNQYDVTSKGTLKSRVFPSSTKW